MFIYLTRQLVSWLVELLSLYHFSVVKCQSGIVKCCDTKKEVAAHVAIIKMQTLYPPVIIIIIILIMSVLLERFSM